MKLFTVRYMWTIKSDADKNSNERVYFKINTDSEKGQVDFVDSLKKIDGLKALASEYLFEYDCDKLGQVTKIFNSEDSSL